MRGKHQCVVASSSPSTGDMACNTGMCPDWELNWRHFDLQAGTQSIEPHQPGQHKQFFLKKEPCRRSQGDSQSVYGRTLGFKNGISENRNRSGRR